ncbi:MAG: protein of unknown function (DUF4288) [Candidatus Electronema aureum]|uniref:DUF4288 domain-containing protein n=1 Tax=Candidatus Electronema aureum TaxID=2005002 RepID=A0A521G263_9BACT|nr:MAG: protein of unknown function (DUF4288) [Candidatus Electronema aureum]
MCDKNVSPVNWYVGSYLLRCVEVEQESKFDQEQQFLAWENTVLVKADSIEKAYDKIEQIAQSSTEPYQAGETAVLVQWLYEGITELLPVYENIEDGCEIMWRERRPVKLKNLRKLVRSKDYFKHDR